MTTHKKNQVGLHPARQAAKARRCFVEILGEAEGVKREMEIAALPAAEWKGKALHTLRCHGETGKGPHDVNVPDSLLWSLISLNGYRCPFHA
jgi:hypothetical protein